MDEQVVNNEIESWFNIPAYLDFSAGLLHGLTSLLIVVGVMVLLTASNRPGRGLMFVGLIGIGLNYLPAFVAEPASDAKTVLLWYLPFVSALLQCVGGIGFLRFALSFK
ncbi:hypothetical protein GCM10008090_32830 [Arenicella chitinivorans]|uniref:Transmembrane protein n=1 Tax=Arenicella chitinivorans TaxID=1329800 RepID=A0A918S4Q3_9GAMM|nr:hypothetical protein [Arenicella chitinivorans]GHA20278.1 hypothetical protein GCM10008090_32830 [Arenicella chitinivorans]